MLQLPFFSWITCLGKPAIKSWAAAPWRAPPVEELRSPANSHMSEPSWKWILKPSDDSNYSWHFDCNLMRDLKPDPPNWDPPEFLSHRKYEMFVALSCQILESFIMQQSITNTNTKLKYMILYEVFLTLFLCWNGTNSPVPLLSLIHPLLQHSSLRVCWLAFLALDTITWGQGQP